MKISTIPFKKKIGIILTAVILASSLIGCNMPNNSKSSSNNNSTNNNTTTEENKNTATTLPEAKVGDFAAATTSVEMAKNMTIGWNLGNTLDATQGYVQNAGINTETGWGMPNTTEEMITDIKNAGFKTIRIPVSWHNHISDTTDYTIDDAWMNRVKQIVDWAYNKNMCVIINIHHDNLSEAELNGNIGFAISKDSDKQAQSKKYIEKIWTQIANKFSNYDNRLVFEVLNEPRAVDTNLEWWCNDQKLINIITSYEQVAVNTIRSVTGNENRFIMVPGYAASGSDGTMLSLYKMPTDTAQDRLLLSAHAYSPYNFAMNDLTDTVFGDDDKGSLDSIFSYLKSNYTDKGIGVVMGEASATDKENLSDRVAWATYYFTKAKEAGIPVVLWDNMVTASTPNSTDIGERHGYYNRRSNSWYFPTMIQAMMKAVYGENYTAQ